MFIDYIYRSNSPLIIVATIVCLSAEAYENKIKVSIRDGLRCIHSNGLPGQQTGQFPNKGNPNSISEHRIKVCVTTNPRKGNTSTPITHGSVGIALNGVLIRPSTADYYDPSSPRGFSRNNQSGWNLEGLGAREQLGMDQNNAHVDRRGLYHYHGIPKTLVSELPTSLIGYAADGFEIHYSGKQQTSSYQLKPGNRKTAPGGAHDGTYNEDWHYVANSGSLDICNGGTLNEQYVYFATDTYPFFPRCLWGKPSQDFLPKQQEKEDSDGRHHNRHTRVKPTHRRNPPKVAIFACSNQSPGNRCSFISPHRKHHISGHCRTLSEQIVACMPNNHK